ncbi:Os07g0272900 [Oryza sativa Japonica Group]|uniref:Os07g0272900 protein n=1 Tax=Oryza sativa subsp. japonica TaxID=39947 RepID=B9FWK9_ORYSJ|nr:hypothetical protein OsJ_23814 [Oryza sativa Japonica Group]BAC83847.1 unknown protein [Oryza sativa Japonica Group]BAD31861.1 unknown protein [Oryza sativa Japonica Group]BAF21264.1 Os07g0272900 [Oryza sativa Japonica Group]|eukprot:NP_001059350.1 Os07g0272900 [Oryza sativa Japonica Group]
MPASMPAAATQHRAGGGGARGERVSVRSSNRAATSPCRSPHHVVLEEEKGGRCHCHLATPASAPASTSPALPRGEEGERGEAPLTISRRAGQPLPPPLSPLPRRAILGAGLHLTHAATRRGRREGRGSSSRQQPRWPAYSTTAVVAATLPHQPRRRTPPHLRRREERKARGATSEATPPHRRASLEERRGEREREMALCGSVGWMDKIKDVVWMALWVVKKAGLVFFKGVSSVEKPTPIL